MVPHGETVFEIDAPRIKFGRGARREAGFELRALGAKRVALFTDGHLAGGPFVADVVAAIVAAGIEVVRFEGVRIEPTDASFLEAAAFARDAKPDAYVSVGGGSVIDTAKAASLYATYPAPFETYVNAPLGEGRPVPGPLPAHVAIPTTAGTGSECTAIAVFDDIAHGVKTGIASRRIRPTLGLVDPDATRTLPRGVVASAAFDVLAHALESYTARPFTARTASHDPASRPLSQGANPYSDLSCLEALRLLGAFVVRAYDDAADDEARGAVMYAATLAGIGFGNAGVHLPHGMSYAVAGGVHAYSPVDYDSDHAMVPHGMSVIVSAPAVARFTAPAAPGRHRRVAGLLGHHAALADDEVGDALAERLTAMMKRTGIPNGLAMLGYGSADIPALVRGTLAQQRLLQNAPRTIDEGDLIALFAAAMRYW